MVSLTYNETISYVCLINDLMAFLVFCCSPRFFSNRDVFYCLSIIRYDWQQLNRGEIAPAEILKAVDSKNHFVRHKISAEQLMRLLDYINNKLPQKEKFFTPNNLKEVWEILGIKPI